MHPRGSIPENSQTSSGSRGGAIVEVGRSICGLLGGGQRCAIHPKQLLYGWISWFTGVSNGVQKDSVME
jgi:hypothetical protein